MSENKLFEEVQNLFRAEKYEECLETIRSLLKKSEKSKYYNYKGLCLFNLCRFQEAIKSYDAAISIYSDQEFYVNKAKALIETLDYSEAHKFIDFCLKKQPNSEIKYLKGDCFFRQNKFHEAIEFYKNCKKSCNESYVNKSLGDSYKNLRHFEKAIEEYDLALEKERKESIKTVVLFQKAMCLMELEKFGQALVELEKAKKIDPNYCKYERFKAKCLYKINKFDLAMEEIKIATNNSLLLPSDLLNIKAHILLKKNSPDQALIYIDSALRINNHPDYFETKGLILHKLGEEMEAIDCFMKAIDKEKKPNQEVIEKMNSIISNLKQSSLNITIIKDKFQKCRISSYDINFFCL